MRVKRDSKHELAARLQGRYVKASKSERGRMLREFVETTGLPPQVHQLAAAAWAAEAEEAAPRPATAVWAGGDSGAQDDRRSPELDLRETAAGCAG